MTRVAIIGGGIGGLTAADALSRAGIEVAVYEAAAELKEIGAGVALHPNAMKVLRAIGVEDGVRKVAGQSQWQVVRTWKTGRVIAKTSRQQQAASFGTEGATVHRADLLDVLADALPADIVTLGKRCTEVRPDGDIAVAPSVPNEAACSCRFVLAITRPVFQLRMTCHCDRPATLRTLSSTPMARSTFIALGCRATPAPISLSSAAAS